jgi:Flp pilus assembly protein TadD
VVFTAGLIALATALSFGNTFAVPFVFDDKTAILENPTIRHLWPIWKTLCPPPNGTTVSGRPLLNLSLAINYATSGLEVRSYHVTNLAIHILAALLLFALVRRTLLLPAMRDRWAAAALPLSFIIALLWAIHPLQTESVTYVVQRAESLMGLLYSLTLYCFLRGADSSRAVWWYAAAVVACLLGMASKEVMVSAPLVVLLYDRTFLAGSFREAWQQRWRLYLPLAGAWLLLGWLVISAGNIGNKAGFDAKISSWAYLCTQFGAIVHYLQLCFWPRPLVLDYGTDYVHNFVEIAPQAALVGLLGLATLVALWRWPKVGFLGAWFFAILAPTSSVFVLAGQTIAEHRMYLPLAAVITGLVVAGYVAGRWLVRVGTISSFGCWFAVSGLVLCASAALGILTFRRNADYRSDLSIWEDTVAKVPHNARAYSSLGAALARHKRVDEAIVHYCKALEIDPDSADAHNNLGVALADRGQVDEAIVHCQKAVEIKPDNAGAHYNLGASLARRKRVDEAVVHYRKALEINPEFAEAHDKLGVALADRGEVDEAIAHFRKAAEIKPEFAEAHYNLGATLARRNRISEAIAHFRKAVEIKPDFVEAHYNLGVALVGQRQVYAAIDCFEKALEIRPAYGQALNNLAWIRATYPDLRFRDGVQAVTLAQRAVELSPNNLYGLDTLAAAYAEARRFPEAVQAAHKALDVALRQNQQALAKSIRARIHLYEEGTPFRVPPESPLQPR